MQDVLFMCIHLFIPELSSFEFRLFLCRQLICYHWPKKFARFAVDRSHIWHMFSSYEHHHSRCVSFSCIPQTIPELSSIELGILLKWRLVLVYWHCARNYFPFSKHWDKTRIISSCAGSTFQMHLSRHSWVPSLLPFFSADLHWHMKFVFANCSLSFQSPRIELRIFYQ